MKRSRVVDAATKAAGVQAFLDPFSGTHVARRRVDMSSPLLRASAIGALLIVGLMALVVLAFGLLVWAVALGWL